MKRVIKSSLATTNTDIDIQAIAKNYNKQLLEIAKELVEALSDRFDVQFKLKSKIVLGKTYQYDDKRYSTVIKLYEGDDSSIGITLAVSIDYKMADTYGSNIFDDPYSNLGRENVPDSTEKIKIKSLPEVQKALESMKEINKSVMIQYYEQILDIYKAW